jgi:hypothetical protein
VIHLALPIDWSLLLEALWLVPIAFGIWTTPRSYVAGEVLTAAILNTDHRDNITVLRAGGIALTSQAAHDVIVATSATQFGRVANGITGAVLVATTSAIPSWSSSPVFGGATTVGLGGPGSGTASFSLNAGSSGDPEIRFKQNGATRAFIYYFDSTSKLHINRTGGGNVGLWVDASDNAGAVASFEVGGTLTALGTSFASTQTGSAEFVFSINRSVVFRFDADNNGTEQAIFRNGAGTDVVTITEAGDIIVTGKTRVQGTLTLETRQDYSTNDNSSMLTVTLTAGVSMLRLSVTGGITEFNIQKITGGYDGRVLIVVNDDAAATARIRSGGGDANSINVPTDPYALGPDAGLCLIYDGGDSRWRVFARAA